MSRKSVESGPLRLSLLAINVADWAKYDSISLARQTCRILLSHCFVTSSGQLFVAVDISRHLLLALD